MKLEEACIRLNQIVGIRFGDLFPPDAMNMITINKGKAGQQLELALGMHLSNTNLDFEDGELKTNKCSADGKPQETIFITQISSTIDELLQGYPFEKTHLYEKISNILYVPVCKEGRPEDWMFLPSIHIDLSQPRFAPLRTVLSNDYYSICKQLRAHVEKKPDGFIHTSNGTLIQIRSKDSRNARGNYHPIYSQVYGRYVSNKNHAFYFKKEFIYYVRQIIENSPII